MDQYLYLPDVILTKNIYEWTFLENRFRKYCFFSIRNFSVHKETV